MRIAISGSHRTGKSTLIEELAAALPTYATVDEPYLLLEEDGYEFAHPPSIEDFEVQLERSLEDAGNPGRDVLFDRCAADFLAYIFAHEDGDTFDLDAWLPRIRAAIQSLDLVVLVPVEEPDRIALSPNDDEPGSRAEVDEKLREILLDDTFEFGVEVLLALGNTEERTKTVLQRIRRGSS